MQIGEPIRTIVVEPLELPVCVETASSKVWAQIALAVLEERLAGRHPCSVDSKHGTTHRAAAR
jgi:hypothetical protein